jgi:hypothetical protein
VQPLFTSDHSPVGGFKPPPLRLGTHLLRSASQKSQSHACTIRCLGMRWLKIIATMIRNGTPYDEAPHTRNQLQHGSCVMPLQPVQIIKKDAG